MAQVASVAAWDFYCFTVLQLITIVSKNNVFLDYIVQLRHSQRMRTHTPINTCTQTLTLWAYSKTKPANSRDDEVTTDASLFTGMSPITECTMQLSPKNLLPWGVKPRTWGATGTQPLGYRSFHQKQCFWKSVLEVLLSDVVGTVDTGFWSVNPM